MSVKAYEYPMHGIYADPSKEVAARLTVQDSQTLKVAPGTGTSCTKIGLGMITDAVSSAHELSTHV